MRPLIAFFILLSGCSFIDDTHYYVQDELKPHVAEFHRQAAIHGLDFKGSNLIVRIDKIRDYCDCPAITFYDEIPEVLIDTDFFNEQQQAIKDAPHRALYFDRIIEISIFHELGHALMKLDHSDGIMSEDAMPFHRYAKYELEREALINDMFKK